MEGLSEEDQALLKRELKESRATRKRLKVLLEKRIKVAEQLSLSTKSYEDPNWAYKQADGVGYKRSLNEIIKLIDF